MLNGRSETDGDRWKKRQVEQCLTQELHSAAERQRVASADKTSPEYARAMKACDIALERWKQFVLHGVIPQDLEEELEKR
jgi:hypothetical protein